MSTRRNGEFMFTGFQTLDYQKEDSVMGHEENQFRKTTNELCKVGAESE
jgi:hypothetical protein